MKTLNRLVVGTALALGLGCYRPTGGRVESVVLPESCAEVVSIERSALHTRGHYAYDVSCREGEGKYRLYVCEHANPYDPSIKAYSCRPDMKFELTGKN